jgi:hypothetical protein
VKQKPHYDVGTYKTEVSGQGFTVASTGTIQFWLRFVVLERVQPFNDNLDKYTRTLFLPITEKTADRVMYSLNTIGFEGDNFDDVNPLHKGYHSFVGLQLEMLCTHEPDQDNQPKERWSLQRVSATPAEDTAVHNLNRFLSSNKKSSRAAAGTGVVPPSHKDGVNDADIPVGR